MSVCHILNCSAYTARYQYVKVNSANPNEIRAQLLQTVTTPGLGDDDGDDKEIESHHSAVVGSNDEEQKNALLDAHKNRQLTAMEAIFMQGD